MARPAVPWRVTAVGALLCAGVGWMVLAGGGSLGPGAFERTAASEAARQAIASQAPSLPSTAGDVVREAAPAAGPPNDACEVVVADGTGRPWPNLLVWLEWRTSADEFGQRLGRTGLDGRLAVRGLLDRRREAQARGTVHSCAFHVECVGLAGPRQEYAGGWVTDREVRLVVPPAGSLCVDLVDARGVAVLQHVSLGATIVSEDQDFGETGAAERWTIPARIEPLALSRYCVLICKTPLRLTGQDPFEAVPGPVHDRQEMRWTLRLSDATPILRGWLRTPAGAASANGCFRAHWSFRGDEHSRGNEYVATDERGRFRLALTEHCTGKDLTALWLDELVDGEETPARAHRAFSCRVRPGEQDLQEWVLEELPLVVRATVRDLEGRPVDAPLLSVEASAPDWLTSGPLKELRPRHDVIAVHGRTNATHLRVRAGTRFGYDWSPWRDAPIGTDLDFALVRTAQAPR
jgi:hypothetical protein